MLFLFLLGPELGSQTVNVGLREVGIDGLVLVVLARSPVFHLGEFQERISGLRVLTVSGEALCEHE